MDIHFASPNEERLCTEMSFAKRKLGAAVAKVLAKRIDQLRAAPHLAAVVFGKPHPLHRNYAGCFGIWLDGAHRVVVRPSNDPLSRLADGSVDRQQVTIVCIEFIGDYHDDPK